MPTPAPASASTTTTASASRARPERGTRRLRELMPGAAGAGGQGGASSGELAAGADGIARGAYASARLLTAARDDIWPRAPAAGPTSPGLAAREPHEPPHGAH